MHFPGLRDEADGGRRAPWLATALLGALLSLVAFGAATASWTSPQNVDNRTYLEMIDGIARHGLPYTTNGPVAQHRELQARWNNYARGRLWGALPPVFPYLAAPAYRVGGTLAVVRLNILMLALLALGVYRLARRLTGDSLAGSAAAWAALVATPASTVALDTSPYATMITAIVWATDCAVASLATRDDLAARRSRWSAAAAGLCAGLAVGAHPLSFPMVAPLLAALFVVGGDADARALAPSRASLVRGACAMAGALAVLVWVGALNHVRFGSWNPVTYGPCVWRSCAETGLDRQGIGPMLRWARPVLVWFAATVAVGLFVRRSRAGLATVAALSLAALAPPSELHNKALALVTLAWGFVVDVSPLTLGYGFVPHPDGLGTFLGPFALKSLLQCSPAALLAALAGSRQASVRRALGLAALPCAALLASLALRANLPTAYALGYPFLYLRYVVPALPLAMVLAVVAVRDLPWRAWHLGVGAAVCAGLSLWLSRWSDDDPHARRVMLLRVTLAVAAASTALVARSRGAQGDDARATGRWSHAAALGATVAFAVSFAVGAAVDLRAVLRVRRDSERRVEAVTRTLPRRFAVMGYPVEIDPVLGLRATRDVEYADLYEARDWIGLRAIVGGWWRDGRPVFVLLPPAAPFPSPMPDARFEVVDRALGVYAVRPVVQPPR